MASTKVLCGVPDCWSTDDFITSGGYKFFLQIESCPSEVATSSDNLEAALIINGITKNGFDSTFGLMHLQRLLSFESQTAMTESGTNPQRSPSLSKAALK